MNAERHAQIKEIFVAACEQPVEDRATWLERACGDDAELAAEVRTLLRRHDQALPTPPLADPDPSATPPLPGSDPLGASPPIALEGFKILQKLGEGGMGEVWEAEQLEPVRRRVALKVLKTGLAGREVLARFDLERQALAMMNHPNIARVLEAGVSEGGRPYFAMERVQGEAITDYCDRHRLTNSQRIALVIEVCRGVEHAHQKGIIHRDLKPSNVLVAVEDGKPVPKIIDFGIAKTIAHQRTDPTIFTHMGQWIGTPEYMSPEQAEMTGLDVDTRTDVYSLGVLLYELLAGAKPFDSQSLRRASFDEVRRRIREEEPTRPSTKVGGLGDDSKAAAHQRRTDVEGLVRELRGDLDWITLKALEKDRTRRYDSPTGLAADLRRHLEHEPVVARPPSLGYRLGKFVRRHRLAVVAASLVVLSLLLGLAMTAMALVHAREEARRARQVSTFLEELITDFNPFINRSAVSMESVLDTAVARLDTELEGQNLVRARLLQRLGVAYRDLGRSDRARPLLEEAHRLFEAELGPRSREAADALAELGWLAWENGEHDRSVALRREVLDVLRRILPEDSPRRAAGQVDLAFGLWAVGRFADSEELFGQALETQERVLGSDHPDVARNLMLQAVLLNSSGDLRRARAAAARSVELRRAFYGDQHVQVAWSLRTLARSERLLGHYDAALEYGRESLALFEAALGPDHPDLGFALETLGATHGDLGQLERAEGLLEKALRLREEALGPDHLEVGLTLGRLAWLGLERRDLERAAPRIERALAISRRSRPADHPEIATRLHTLATLRRLEGRLGEAQALEQEATTLLRGTLGAEHPLLARHLAHLGVLEREEGRLASAREFLEEALERHREALGPNHRIIADDLLELAILERSDGHPERATRRFAEACGMYEATVGTGHPASDRCRREQTGGSTR